MRAAVLQSPFVQRTLGIVAICSAIAIVAGTAVAQLPPPGDSGAGSPSSSPGAIPGGGVVADFDTLMNLIQQTIDPDSWLQAGGTNTINPYPAGVYVDPKGYMKRLKESGRAKVGVRLHAHVVHQTLVNMAFERPIKGHFELRGCRRRLLNGGAKHGGGARK